MLPPSNIGSYTCKVATTWLPKCNLSKENSIEHGKREAHKTSGIQNELQVSKQRHEQDRWYTIWLYSTKWSALKTYIQINFTYSQQAVFRPQLCVYTNTYMHAVTIEVKTHAEVKGELGEV